MKSAKIFIAFTFLLACAFCVSAQKSKTVKSQSLKLSTNDKTEIIRQVFAAGFEKLIGNSQFNQCLTPIIDDKKVIFLMTDFDENLIPKSIKEYRFMIMSYSQINKEVKKNNGECYFELKSLPIVDTKVRISLSRIVDEIYNFKDSLKPARWISGEGYIYEFQKAKSWKIVSTNKIIISS